MTIKNVQNTTRKPAEALSSSKNVADNDAVDILVCTRQFLTDVKYSQPICIVINTYEERFSWSFTFPHYYTIIFYFYK